MQHYRDVVQDRSGNVIGGAIVTVIDHLSGQSAPLYSDANGFIPLTSVITDTNGTFSFYVASGRYDITVSKNGIVLNSVSDVFITVTADYPTAMSQADATAGISTLPQTISASVLQTQKPTAMDSATAQAGTSTTAQTVSASVLKAGVDANANVVKTYASVSAIPSGFVGTARVGTDLYVGNGIDIKQQNQDLLPADVVAIGDSTMLAQFDTAYAGLTWGSAYGDGFLTLLNYMRNGAHRVRMNGYSGYSTTDWLDGTTFGLGALKAMSPVPKLAFVCFGANDFYLSNNTAVNVLANVHTILNELNALNIKAIWLNGYPRDKYTNLGPGNVWSSAKQTQHWAYLSALPALFADYPQHRLIDTYSLASDNGAITGNLAAGFMADGLHPNANYALAIANNLNTLLPASESLLLAKMVSSNDNRLGSSYSKNRLGTGIFQGLSIGSWTPSGVYSNITLDKCTVSHELVAGGTYSGFPYTTCKSTIVFNSSCTIMSPGEFALNISDANAIVGFPWKSSVKTQILSSTASVIQNYIRGKQDDGTTQKYVSGGILQHAYSGLTTTANGALAATSMTAGISYIITVVGTTNWTNLGALTAIVGSTFVYNGNAVTGSGGLCLPSINNTAILPVDSAPKNIVSAEGAVHATATSQSVLCAVTSISAGTVVFLSSEYCLWQYPSPILN